MLRAIKQRASYKPGDMKGTIGYFVLVCRSFHSFQPEQGCNGPPGRCSRPKAFEFSEIPPFLVSYA